MGFWYWMHGAISKDAITADLDSMKQIGLGGAYIFAIKDVTDPPLYDPSFHLPLGDDKHRLEQLSVE
ncbi:MAG: glycosyl hydrolase [Bacteroidota bacterium]|nr:glycosyl hydrolase [Bacteroidota bacterium]